MASKPTDLTRKGWDKVKQTLAPKTGFGDKLDAYQAARKKTIDLPTRNLAAYKAAAAVLETVTKHIPVAQGKLNKTLHKDTIEALAAYKGLIDKEGLALAAEFNKYQGYVDKYKNLRDVCGKEMTVIRASVDALAQKALAAAKPLVTAGKVPEVTQLGKTTKAELDKLQKAADASIAKPRVPGPAAETPHADDRPDASVFTALINKQTEIIAVRKNTEAALDKAIVDAKKNKPLDPKPALKNIVVKAGSGELGRADKGVFDRASKQLVVVMQWKNKALDPLQSLQAAVDVAADFEDADVDGDFKMKMKVAGIMQDRKTVRLQA